MHAWRMVVLSTDGNASTMAARNATGTYELSSVPSLFLLRLFFFSYSSLSSHASLLREDWRVRPHAFSRVCSNFDCLMWSTVYCLWSSTTHRLRLSTIIHGWIFAIRKTVLHSFLNFLGLCRRWRHPNYVNASIPKDQLNHISVYLFLYCSVSLRSPPCNFCNHVWLVAKL